MNYQQNAIKASNKKSLCSNMAHISVAFGYIESFEDNCRCMMLHFILESG